jgi:hypothetical protein
VEAEGEKNRQVRQVVLEAVGERLIQVWLMEVLQLLYQVDKNKEKQLPHKETLEDQMVLKQDRHTLQVGEVEQVK